MIPVRKNSKIEVCSADYINKHYNNEEDKDSKIVQIEHGYNGDYIVELVNRKNPFSWWRPISEYNTSRRCEPMLIKIFNRNTKQYIPLVAWLREDGKWCIPYGDEIPYGLEVISFFDISLLEEKKENGKDI